MLPPCGSGASLQHRDFSRLFKFMLAVDIELEQNFTLLQKEYVCVCMNHIQICLKSHFKKCIII